MHPFIHFFIQPTLTSCCLWALGVWAHGNWGGPWGVCGVGMADVPEKQPRTQESEREGRNQESPDLGEARGEVEEEDSGGQALWGSAGEEALWGRGPPVVGQESDGT